MQSSQIDCAEQQATLQSWIPMGCVQLSRGKRLGQLDSISLGDQRIVREHQYASVQKLGAMPPDLCTLSYCTIDPSFRFSDLGGTDRDALFLMSGDTEFDIYVPEGAETTYVCLDESDLLAAARVLNPRQWQDFPQGVNAVRTEQITGLRQLIGLLFSADWQSADGEVPFPDHALRYALQQVVLAIATLPDQTGATARPRASKLRTLSICRTARDYALARLEDDEPPAMVDICAEVGVSERTLQYAFQDYIGMSPLAYFRQLRLNRVRTILSAAGPSETTVTSVAMQLGFLHLGRFAQDYRRAFEETPSVTLAS